MAEPTLTSVFGAGATQTATTLTINKSDLAATGLTASSDNTAESLLAAIVLTAQNELTLSAFESNPDQSITVAPSFQPVSIVSRDDGTGNGTLVTERRNELTVAMHAPDASTINADDY